MNEIFAEIKKLSIEADELDKKVTIVSELVDEYMIICENDEDCMSDTSKFNYKMMSKLHEMHEMMVNECTRIAERMESRVEDLNQAENKRQIMIECRVNGD